MAWRPRPASWPTLLRVTSHEPRKALTTQDPKDDLRAEAWRVEFDFKTPPDEALVRGDLDPGARQMAMDQVEKNRAAGKGPMYPTH